MIKKKNNSMLSFLLAIVITLTMLPTMNTAVLAAATMATNGSFVVSLDADAPTAGSHGFGTGSNSNDGRIWTDKTVTVNSTGGFDVKLSALAQEYLQTAVTTSGGGISANALAADVVFILDMSTSMNNTDNDAYGGATRVQAMIKAVNEAITIIMEANPKNRVAVHWFGYAVSDINNHVGTFLPMGSYATTTKSPNGYELKAGTLPMYLYCTNSTTVSTAAGLSRTDSGTFTAVTKTIGPGTPTQDGIFYGIKTAIRDIGLDTLATSGKRQPFAFLLSDGAASIGDATWWQPYNYANGNQLGTDPAKYTRTTAGVTGLTSTGSNEAAAVTILTAALMRDELTAAYSAYNGDNAGRVSHPANFYTVGLGSNTALYSTTTASNYAWCGLDPNKLEIIATASTKPAGFEGQNFSYDKTAAAETVKKINDYVNTAGTAYKKYAATANISGITAVPGAADGYKYTRFYQFANNLTTLSGAFEELSNDVKTATQSTTMPIVSNEETGSGEVAAAITFTDVLGENMVLDGTPTLGGVSGTLTGETYTFDGHGSTVTVSTNSNIVTLTWKLAPADMSGSIYKYKNINKTSDGYNAANPIALAYKARLAPTLTPTANVTKTMYEASAGNAKAVFTPTSDNPYYYHINGYVGLVGPLKGSTGVGLDQPSGDADITHYIKGTINIAQATTNVYITRGMVAESGGALASNDIGSILSTLPAMPNKTSQFNDELAKTLVNCTAADVSDSTSTDANFAFKSGIVKSGATGIVNKTVNATNTDAYVSSTAMTNSTITTKLGNNGIMNLIAGIAKSGSPSSVSVGGTITYTATVYNYTNTPLADVSVTSEGSTKTITEVPANGSATQTFTATAPTTAQEATSGTASVTVSGKTIESNTVKTTVTAKAKYTVNYHANGGTPEPTQLTVDDGDKINVPTQPAKEGFLFGGWYSNSDLTVQWNFGTNTVTTNTDLYARWIDEFAVTVNLKLDGGAYENKTVKLYQGETEKYTLAGNGGAYSGTDVKNGEYKVYVGGTDTGTTVTVNLAAASVDINYFTATFDLDGGTSTSDASLITQVLRSGAIPTAPNDPTKPDNGGVTFEFMGWSPTVGALTNTTTYTAQWNETITAGIATVIVYKDGVQWTGEGAPAITIIDEDENIATNGTVLDLGTYKIYADGIYTGKTITVNSKTNTANIEYYTLSFNLNGGNSTAISSQVLLSGSHPNSVTAPTRDGYNFKGWAAVPASDYAGSGIKTWQYTNTALPTDCTVTNTATLYAVWEEKNAVSGLVTIEYTYTENNELKAIHDFDRATAATIILKQNGNQISTTDVEFDKTASSSTQPFSFANQPISDADGVAYNYTVETTVINYDSSADTGNHQLTLTYNPPLVDVAFDVTTATGTAASVIPDNIQVKVLYRNHGDLTFAEIISQHATTGITSTLANNKYSDSYPVWRYNWLGELYDYQIIVTSYSKDGMEYDASGFEITYGNWVWYNSGTGEANARMSALLTPKIYQISYELNSGIGSNSGSYTYGVGLNTLPVPTRDEYRFEGWFEDSNFEGKVESISAYSTGDITLYAKWRLVVPDTYDITGDVKDKATADEIVGANVSIWQNGNEFYGPINTDSNGEFEIINVPAGVYNLVVEYNDGGEIITVTQIIVVPDTLNVHISMDISGRKSSIFHHHDQVRVDAVAGLNEVFNNVGTNTDDKLGVTTDDMAVVAAGGEVIVRLEASEPTDQSQLRAVRNQVQRDNKVIGYELDLSAFKDVTPLNTNTTTTQLDQLNNLVTVYIPLPPQLIDKTGYAVYRYHGTGVDIIPIKPNTNSSGESFEIIDNGKILALTVKKFSVYAIAVNPVNNGNNTIIIFPSIPDGNNNAQSNIVEIKVTENGAVKASSLTPAMGSKVTVMVTPDKGYQVNTLKITDANGNIIAYTKNADGTYSFIQPSGKAIVSATFKPLEDSEVKYLNTVDHIAYVQGRPGNVFVPNDNMTRAEVAQMLYNLLADKNIAKTKSFPDIVDKAWYATAVKTLASIDVILGRTDGQFHPNDNVTRAEFTALIVRFVTSSPNGKAEFIDVPETHWAYNYIGTATNYGWIKGVGNEKFDPDRKITRAEVVTIMNRVLKRTPDKTYIDMHPEVNRFTDMNNKHWAFYQIMEASIYHDYKKAEETEAWETTEGFLNVK